MERKEVLFIDSNSELWHTYQEEFGLKYISMPYTLDGIEYYYDLGKATDFKHFYKRVREGSIPITSALNAFNYKEYFEPYFAKGYSILYLTFSHQLSATFNQLDVAIKELSEQYPEAKYKQLDTRSISTGAGLVNYYAGKMFSEGKSLEEIYDFAADFIEHTYCCFVVDSLAHLKRGGRISSTKAVMGTLLGVKPLIKVDDIGKLINVANIKGSKNVYRQLADIINNNIKDLGKYKIFLMHADCPEMAMELKNVLRERLGDGVDIDTQIIGPTVATHCGPNTLGLAFYANHR